MNTSKLENVAIAHCSCTVQPPGSSSRLNYDAMPSMKSLNINCRIIAFLLLIHYFTLWPWPLT